MHEYDRYFRYPCEEPDGYLNYLVHRVTSYCADNDETSIVALSNGKVVGFIGFRQLGWDTDVFGFNVGFIDYLIALEEDAVSARLVKDELLKVCETWCLDQGIRFISTRFSVEDLTSIHLFEDYGYRYIETGLRPVFDYRKDALSEDAHHPVRLASSSDMDELIELARYHHYAWGRHHADAHFSKLQISDLREKWIRTSMEAGDLVHVVELEGRLQGYFISKTDPTLSEMYGLRYTRWNSAVLSAESRGKGLGVSLFLGTLKALEETTDVVDSGFITRNLPSMNLHFKLNFDRVVFSSVTYHKWFE